MIKYVITLLHALLLTAISYSQPLTVQERKWLIEEMGEPEGTATINIPMDTILLLEKKYPPEFVVPASLDKLNALIKKDPENVDYYLYKFRFLYKNKKEDEALQVLNNARQYFNDKLAANPSRIKYAKAISDIFDESGNGQMSLEFWRALAIENYTNIDCNMQAMRYYITNNQPDSAASFRDIAFGIDPLNPELLVWEFYYQNYYFLTHTSELEKDWKNAHIFNTNKIDMALVSDPGNRQALLLKLSLLAFQEYTICLIFGAQRGDLDSTLSITYNERKQQVAAVESGLLSLLKKKSNNSFLLNMDLMLINTIKQDSVALTKYFSEAIKILPKMPVPYRLIAMFNAIYQNYKPALGFLSKAINLTHEAEDYVFATTLVYRTKGEDSALNFLIRNEKYFTDHTDFALRKSWMAIATGNPSLALANLESISDDDKKDKADRIAFYKAGALMVKGDRKAAGTILKSMGSESEYLKESKSIVEHFKL